MEEEKGREKSFFIINLLGLSARFTRKKKATEANIFYDDYDIERLIHNTYN